MFGGDGGTTYNRMMKEIHEQLSWTCRGRGLIVHIGDYDVKKRFNMAVSMLVLLLFCSLSPSDKGVRALRGYFAPPPL